MDYVVPFELAEKWKQEHQAAVYELAAQHDIDNDRIHFLDEHPREAIPEMARNVEADLVIMGVVSRRSGEQGNIGYTAEYVLDRLECDVLVVPVQASAD